MLMEDRGIEIGVSAKTEPYKEDIESKLERWGRILASLEDRMARLENKMDYVAYDVEAWSSEIVEMNKAIDDLLYEMDMEERKRVASSKSKSPDGQRRLGV